METHHGTAENADDLHPRLESSSKQGTCGRCACTVGFSVSSKACAQRESIANTVTVRNVVTVATQDGPVRFITFRGLQDDMEHIVAQYSPSTSGATSEAPLVRIHSACFTGDVFGSLHCDCGPQLAEARHRCREAGGYIIYLQQEGRGIGLYAKLDAYTLQQKSGLDTIAANEALGFPADCRDYSVAAQMLAALAITRVRLLTNNPEKVSALSAAGLVVTQVCTATHRTTHNTAYLLTKQRKSHHQLDITSF